jgi:hypothetical protein
MDEEGVPPECFICTENAPAPRRSACKCRDRYVHDACLVRMLETGTHDRCPVCLAPYANLVCSYEVVSWQARSHGGCVCVYILFSTILFVCSANTWWCLYHEQDRLSLRAWTLALLSAILMSLFSCVAAILAAYDCTTVGVSNLARSMLVYRRRARVTGVVELARTDL